MQPGPWRGREGWRPAPVAEGDGVWMSWRCHPSHRGNRARYTRDPEKVPRNGLSDPSRRGTSRRGTSRRGTSRPRCSGACPRGRCCRRRDRCAARRCPCPGPGRSDRRRVWRCRPRSRWGSGHRRRVTGARRPAVFRSDRACRGGDSVVARRVGPRTVRARAARSPNVWTGGTAGAMGSARVSRTCDTAANALPATMSAAATANATNRPRVDARSGTTGAIGASSCAANAAQPASTSGARIDETACSSRSCTSTAAGSGSSVMPSPPTHLRAPSGRATASR